MKRVVISLGGSTIIPSDVDSIFIRKFRNIISRLKNYQFVIITGGGSVARSYMNTLLKEGMNKDFVAHIGADVTRLNARFMSDFFFGHKHQIPRNLNEVKNMLEKNRVVFTGALRFQQGNTSDGTAASIARFLKAEFINLTDVNGLYNKDPKKFRDAKLIKKISFDKFYNMVKKIKYKPGMHFVLDKNAAEIIKKYKIKTAILGKNLKSLENYLKGKRFIGTVIN